VLVAYGAVKPLIVILLLRSFCVELSCNRGCLTITDLACLTQTCTAASELVRHTAVIEWDHTKEYTLTDANFARLPLAHAHKIHLRRCTLINNSLLCLRHNTSLRDLRLVDCPSIDDRMMDSLLPRLKLLKVILC
jgi:hypothetical protein